MTNRTFVSRKRGAELVASGCPLDYVDFLPRSVPKHKPFRIEQLGGYIESCLYAYGPTRTGYVVALRLRSDRQSGVVIKDWSFEPPWPDHFVCWDYEPSAVIPERHMGAYRHLLDSRLMQVLNDRYRVRRDRPIEGLLCGYSHQPAPEFRDLRLSAKLTLVDDNGNRAALGVKLVVVRNFPPRWEKPRKSTSLHGDDDGNGPVASESDPF